MPGQLTGLQLPGQLTGLQRAVGQLCGCPYLTSLQLPAAKLVRK